MSLDSLFAGIRRFQQSEFPSRSELFRELGGGQKPELLLITCSDSRIDPALLTQTQPGEVFVIRNAGNIVPPASIGTGGEAATIEYAMEALKIPHIAVCGHTHCGAMAALRNPASAEGLEMVPGWLEHAKPALERQEQLGDGGDALSNTVAANVLAQLDHVRSHPSVARALDEGRVTLHAWVYDFERGELYVADADGAYLPLHERLERAVA